MTSPYLAVPVKENVAVAESEKLTELAVKPVVPTPIVNALSATEVSNPVLVIVIEGELAPFEIVLDVEMLREGLD